MIKIENRLSQPLVINQGKGRVLHLLAGGRAVIDDADLETSEIRELLDRGALSAKPLREVSPETLAAAEVGEVEEAAETVVAVTPQAAAEAVAEAVGEAAAEAVAEVAAASGPQSQPSAPQAKPSQPKSRKEN